MSKRILALVMVVVLAFCINASALASGNTTGEVTLSFYIEGDWYFDVPVDLSDLTASNGSFVSAKDAIDYLDEDYLAPVEWERVVSMIDPDGDGYFEPEYAGGQLVYHFALTELMGLTTGPITSEADRTAFKQAYYPNDVLSWSNTYIGYAQVGSYVQDADDPTVFYYTYVYAGFDWQYSAEDATGTPYDVSTMYLDAFELHDGDVIVFDYNYYPTEWTQVGPISGF